MSYKYLLPSIFFIFLCFSCSDKIINSQADKNHCLIFGQLTYNFSGMIEEGLRGIILVNLQTGQEYEARIFPYEKGFVAVNVPVGQYAIKNAKWLFLDTTTLAKSGIYRQLLIEIKFTSQSYNKTNFEIKKGGVFYYGTFQMNHSQTNIENAQVTNQLFILLDKILDRLEFSSWKKMFKEKIVELFNKHKTLAYTFLKSKFPENKNKPYEVLKTKYLTD